MTVCIAGINVGESGPLIIAACDRKISFFGGYFSAEGVAMKIAGVNLNWCLMFSGPVSPLVPLVESMRTKMNKHKTPSGVAVFARKCSEVYKKERRLLIENEVLCDYDIETYAEYLDQKKKEPELFAAITERIKDEEENWNLLFAGFDATARPHIFVIKERGRIQYCDTEGFAAIGSGGWRSLVALSSYPFRRGLPLSRAIFGIAAAKFAAESEAEGVGEDTVLTIIEPATNNAPIMLDHCIGKLRKLWKELPRFPKDAEVEVWKGLTEMMYAPGIANNPFFKALAKRNSSSMQSGAQTSGPEQ